MEGGAHGGTGQGENGGDSLRVCFCGEQAASQEEQDLFVLWVRFEKRGKGSRYLAVLPLSKEGLGPEEVLVGGDGR